MNISLLLFVPVVLAADPYREFLREAKLAKGEQKRCELWEKEPPFSWGRLDSNSKGHESEKDALRALSLLERQPMEFPHGVRAANLYLENVETFFARSNQKEFLEHAYLVEAECRSLLPLKHFPLLYKDLKRFSFTPAERKRLEVATSKYLWNKSDGGRLGIMFYGIQIEVLRRYIALVYDGENKAAWQKEADGLEQNFEAERKNIASAAKDSKNESASMLAEVTSQRRIRLAYVELLKKVLPRL